MIANADTAIAIRLVLLNTTEVPPPPVEGEGAYVSWLSTWNVLLAWDPHGKVGAQPRVRISVYLWKRSG